MLSRKSQSLNDVIRTLRVFHENIDVVPDVSMSGDSHRTPSQKEVLEGLIAALDTSDVR
jgi:beta-catenin-like protein 1